MDTIDNISMPEQTATPLERLKYLLKLSRKTQAGFSRLIGIDPSSTSKIMSGRMPLTQAFINRVVVNLGVSKDWLERGEGVPFPRSEGAKVVNAGADHFRLTNAPKGAPVYDIDATAGCMPLSRMFTSDNIIGYLDLPQVNPGYPVVRVSGNSMMPRIPDGSYIAIREIRDTSIIMWGAIYLVQLEDYRMVKYVRKHSDDTSKIILHSENPDYDDIEIDRSAVLKLFIVEAIINCQSLV